LKNALKTDQVNKNPISEMSPNLTKPFAIIITYRFLHPANVPLHDMAPYAIKYTFQFINLIVIEQQTWAKVHFMGVS